MSEHASLSASAAHRWMNCPVAPWREKEIPDSGSHAADEGSYAHAILHSLLTGDVFDKDDRFDTEAIMAHVEPIAARWLAMGGDILSEVEVPLKGVTGEDHNGTADIVLIQGGVLHIADLKYGHRAVEVNNNLQLIIYALAALDVVDNVEMVTLTIEQPRLGRTESVSYGVDEIETWRPVIAEKARRVFAREGVATPGEAQCHYCKVGSGCPERIAAVFDVVESKSLNECMLKVGMVEAWCKQVREDAMDAVMKGEVLPDFKVVEGREGNRDYVDKAAAEAILATWRVPKRLTHRHEMLSAPKVVEVLKKFVPHRADKFAGMIHRAKGKPTLVPLADPRPAIVVGFETVNPEGK